MLEFEEEAEELLVSFVKYLKIICLSWLNNIFDNSFSVELLGIVSSNDVCCC